MQAPADACSNDGSTNLGTCSTANDDTAGQCDCTTGDYYDCSIERDADYAGTCGANTVNCEEAHTYDCTGPVCNCNDAYTTDTDIEAAGCAVPRVYAACGATADFKIYPHGGFPADGSIYFMNAAGDDYITTCGFTAGTFGGDSLPRWTYDAYPYESPGTIGTGCPVPNTGTNGAGNTYQWWVYLQYQKFRSAADLKISITCQAVAGEETLSPVVSVQFAEQIPVSSTQTATAESGVTFGLHLTGGTADITAEVPAGTLVDARFAVDLTLIPQFTVLSIQVGNYPPDLASVPDDGDSFYLINFACVTQDGGSLVTGLSKETGSGVIIITFRGFRWPKQADGYKVDTPSASVPVGTSYFLAVVYIGTYTTTRPGAGLCSAVPAGDGGPMLDYAPDIGTTAFRRKKRQVDDESRNVYLNVSLVIADPFQTSSSYQPEYKERRGDDASCYQSAAFIIPLVLMGLLVLLTAAMAVFLYTRLTRHQGNRMDGETNMAYK